MTVIISNGATNLSTVNGFYRVEASNMGMFSTTDLALTSTRTIAITFANAGNCQGLILALNTASYNIDRSVVVELQQGPGWGIVATVTLTANQITNSVANKLGDAWIVPFSGGTFPFAVDTTAGKWRFQVYQTGGSVGVWNIRTSNASAPFFVTWCDNAVSFANNDCVIAKDVITIDQTATFRGVLGTGDAARSVCAIACRSTTPTPDNVSQFVWQNPPVAAYTLTIDGLMVLSCHAGVRVGTLANPIPVAQAATITIQQVPTSGSVGNSGFADSEHSLSTSSVTRKTSLFLYGVIPAHERTTLNANAVTGQPDIVTTDDLSLEWAIGDSVYVGKQNVKGEGDLTARTINNIVGATITLSSNLLTANRIAGGQVIRMNGYGIVFQSSNTTTVTMYLRSPSNFEISGCQIKYITINTSTAGGETALDDAANYEAMIVTHSSIFGAAFLNWCGANEAGLTFSYVNSFIGTVFVSLYAGTSLISGISGVFAISQCVILSMSSNISPGASSRARWTMGNCIIENNSYVVWQPSGVRCALNSNTFWGCDTAVIIQTLFDSTFNGNTYNNCNYALKFQNYPSMGNILTGEIFGGAIANTTDIYFDGGGYTQCEFVSPTLTTLNTTNMPYSLPGSLVRFTTYSGVVNDDRGYTPYGIFQRVGEGLADTTRHTVGTDKFALRLQPTSSVNSLAWNFVVPTGDISTKTMTVVCWVKINNASYYAGVHQNPKLTVNYDNGTLVSYTALDNTNWQLLPVNFTPVTNYGQIEITLDGFTDAVGVNAYFYVDDFAILYPAGYTLDLGGIDLFAHALPVVPPIATSVSALDVWNAQTSVMLGVGTMGKLLVDNIDMQLSDLPTAVEIRQEIDNNSADLNTIVSDLATLLTRLTALRATNLDNLDMKVSDVPLGTWNQLKSSIVVVGSIGEHLKKALRLSEFLGLK